MSVGFHVRVYQWDAEPSYSTLIATEADYVVLITVVIRAKTFMAIGRVGKKPLIWQNVMPRYEEIGAATEISVYLPMYTVAGAVYDGDAGCLEVVDGSTMPVYPNALMTFEHQPATDGAMPVLTMGAVKDVFMRRSSRKPATLVAEDGGALSDGYNIFDLPPGSKLYAVDLGESVPFTVHGPDRDLTFDAPLGTTYGALRALLRSEYGLDATFMYFRYRHRVWFEARGRFTDHLYISDDRELPVCRYHLGNIGRRRAEPDVWVELYQVKAPQPRQRTTAVTQNSGTCWFHAALYILLESPVFADMLKMRRRLDLMNCNLDTPLEDGDGKGDEISRSLRCFRMLKTSLGLVQSEEDGGCSNELVTKVLNRSNPGYASFTDVKVDEYLDFDVADLVHKMEVYGESKVVIVRLTGDMYASIRGQWVSAVEAVLGATAGRWTLAGAMLSCSPVPIDRRLPPLGGHIIAAIPNLTGGEGRYRVRDSNWADIITSNDLIQPMTDMCEEHGFCAPPYQTHTNCKVSLVLRATSSIPEPQTPTPTDSDSPRTKDDLGSGVSAPARTFGRRNSSTLGGGSSNGILAVCLGFVAVLGAAMPYS